jgi:hypothetical protein
MKLRTLCAYNSKTTVPMKLESNIMRAEEEQLCLNNKVISHIMVSIRPIGQTQK